MKSTHADRSKTDCGFTRRGENGDDSVQRRPLSGSAEMMTDGDKLLNGAFSTTHICSVMYMLGVFFYI